ncbi:MAG TPA: ClpX C4-type zinc finger protein [Vicinamibacterales bacterium]|nr:ClpX C4-type zinc finger protein [Vicinamibacterales bacterium]
MWFRGLRCSFCRRADADVEKLVAGARGYICDRCAREVMRIIESSETPDRKPATRPVVVERLSEWSRRWHFRTAAAPVTN